jgi:hypothetical protein
VRFSRAISGKTFRKRFFPQYGRGVTPPQSAITFYDFDPNTTHPFRPQESAPIPAPAILFQEKRHARFHQRSIGPQTGQEE